MRPRLLTALLFAALAPALRAQDDDTALWEQLAERPIPTWFGEAKLGIFVHWGVYSVPSWCGPEQYAEWFLRGLQSGDRGRIGFLRRVYGEDFDYRDLAPLFRAELFDPAEWAEVFRASGAGYVVLTAKHHDGYCLWPSAQAPGWNSVDVGPGRDLVGDLSTAVRAAGLRMGLYYSLPEWNHPLYRWANDHPDNDVQRYVDEHMVPQFRDLMARYRPSVVFSDGDWDHPASVWRSAELIRWLREESGSPDDIVVNDRWGSGCTVGFGTPEYSAGKVQGTRPWAECRGLGRSFGLNRAEKLDAYLTAAEVVHLLVGTVSHGGGLLLNVGPGADGKIPLLQQERLRQLGDWLRLNGDAIYGTTAWQRAGEWRDEEIQRVDASIDFDWVRNAPMRGVEPDHFTAEWTGFLRPRVTGEHRLVLTADDRASLELGGQVVLAEPGEARIELRADEPVALRLRFEEATHQAVVQLRWQPPGSPLETIPAAALARDRGGELAGLDGRYRSRRQWIAYTQKGDRLFVIALEWPRDALQLELPQPPSGAQVRLLGTDAAIGWAWEDGTLTLDATGLRPHEVPGRHAFVFEVPLR